tara:strand:+ start:871 stop:1719 length:849 start_codon:yes stop_codon:yes gene_type:complete
MHISLDSALGRQKRLNQIGETINSIASPAAAYSLRSLNGGDPKVVRVRRSSDNAESDFNVSGVNSGALVAFVGSGNDGFVETWYDQSGNSNDLTQTTAGEQPKIVSSGSLLSDGIDFDGSDDTLSAASVSGFGAATSIFEASIRDSGGAAVVSMGSSASTSNTNFGIVEAGSNTQASVRNTTSRTVNASVSGSTRLGFAVTTSQTSTKVGALGGTLVESTDDYGNDFTSGELDTIFFGKLRAGSGSTFNGHIKEALIYTSDQSSNRNAIEANIANYYNITLV